MADKKNPDATTTGRRGNLPLAWIGGIVGAVVLAFLFVQLAIPAGAPGADESAVAASAWKEEKYSFPMIFGNLANTNGKRYLKVGLSMKFASPKPPDDLVRFEGDFSAVKDRLLLLISGKTLEDIDGADNKRRLKAEIKDALATVMFSETHPGRILEVYYDEFLVQ